MQRGCGRCLFAFLILVLLCMFVGCLRSVDGGEANSSVDNELGRFETEPDETEPAETEAATESQTETATEETAEPEPQFELGIYYSSFGRYLKCGMHESFWPENSDDPAWVKDTWTNPGKTNLISDVAYFGIFPFADGEHPFVDYGSEYMAMWREAGLDGYKIGLEFKIELRDGTEHRFTVLGAEDTMKYEEYFEVYLYDDVAHAGDNWYTHITPRTTYEDTLITTFKLTLREGCYDINCIFATAFLYRSADEFDADGFYTGVEKYTSMIRRDFEQES